MVGHLNHSKIKIPRVEQESEKLCIAGATCHAQPKRVPSRRQWDVLQVQFMHCETVIMHYCLWPPRWRCYCSFWCCSFWWWCCSFWWRCCSFWCGSFWWRCCSFWCCSFWCGSFWWRCCSFWCCSFGGGALQADWQGSVGWRCGSLGLGDIGKPASGTPIALHLSQGTDCNIVCLLSRSYHVQ